MNIKKIRFLEPGNRPYRRSIKNLYTYERYIRNPSIGLLTLATIVQERIVDTFVYSESISKIVWEDVLDADIVFIGVFTFNAIRGYELARYVKEHSDALVVMGGLHASLNYSEAVQHCNYVLLDEGDESILEFLEAVEGGVTPAFPGVAYFDENKKETVHTGARPSPCDIDVIPNRDLMYRYKKMAGHSTLWPQVHASRGCPHACDYCAVVQHFGRKIRTRSPENVLEDIRQSIAFHDKRLMPRFSKVCWITDDNFFADRDWAISVLKALIASDIKYRFTIQARYEVGLDDEMLDLLKQAGFIELAMGIEFLEDENFTEYHKKSSREEIIQAIHNTQKHGLSVRGLFILGAKHHTEGVGTRLAEFVEENKIKGVLLQAMYFVPGTPAYEQNKDRLIHEDWSKYQGNAVHYPDLMTPVQLQKEVITASASIYSGKNLRQRVFHGTWIEKVLAIGEHFWQKSVRSDMEKELIALESGSSYL